MADPSGHPRQRRLPGRPGPRLRLQPRRDHPDDLPFHQRHLRQRGLQPVPATPGGFLPGPAGELQKRQVEDFLLAFDSNLAPIVGQQTTLTQDNGAVVGARIDLLIDRARAGECDLVAKRRRSRPRGEGLSLRRRLGPVPRQPEHDAPLSDASLRQRALQKGGELTYTCTPPGSGVRIGIDRDEDGVLDGDEEDDGSDFADAAKPSSALPWPEGEGQGQENRSGDRRLESPG